MGKKLNKINKLVATMLSLVLLLGITSPIKVKAATVTGQDVVNEARKYTGVRYTWGGTNPSTGFDCSGFTQYVYGCLGIALPRVISTDMASQRGVGTKISSIDDLQIGDLVITYNYDHVGIYVGNGYYINSPQTGDHVREMPITSFVEGRRVPGVVSDYKGVHVGEYINVKPFMVTFPIFKDDTSWETYNRLCLLSAPISVKVLDNPSKNVYKVKDCRYGYVGYVYVEENNNYTFTSYQAYSEESLYKTLVNCVQVSDLCSTKWIPGIVEEQLQKDVRTIQISKCNNTSTSYQANLDTKVGSGEALYKIVVDGVQVSDMCSKEWIPGIVEEQLGKDVNDIIITRCN